MRKLIYIYIYEYESAWIQQVWEQKVTSELTHSYWQPLCLTPKQKDRWAYWQRTARQRMKRMKSMRLSHKQTADWCCYTHACHRLRAVLDFSCVTHLFRTRVTVSLCYSLNLRISLIYLFNFNLQFNLRLLHKTLKIYVSTIQTVVPWTYKQTNDCCCVVVLIFCRHKLEFQVLRLQRLKDILYRVINGICVDEVSQQVTDPQRKDITQQTRNQPTRKKETQ